MLHDTSIGSEDSPQTGHTPLLRGVFFLATFRTYGLREFFIEERTASNIILDNDEYYRELIRNKTTRKQLRRTYPGFDWN